MKIYYLKEGSPDHPWRYRIWTQAMANVGQFEIVSPSEFECFQAVGKQLSFTFIDNSYLD